NDQRVNANIPIAEAELEKHHVTYSPNIFEGAGHGFLRNQSGQDGANLKAVQQAWPKTLAFLRQYTDAGATLRAFSSLSGFGGDLSRGFRERRVVGPGRSGDVFHLHH